MGEPLAIAAEGLHYFAETLILSAKFFGRQRIIKSFR
jgi:hypothetical protein